MKGGREPEPLAIFAYTSTLSLQFYVLETAQQSSFSLIAGDNSWALNVAGVGYGGNFTFDARPAGLQSWLFLNTTLVVGHNPDGNQTVATAASASSVVLGGASFPAQYIALPRIPRGPFVEINGTWSRTLAYAEINGAWQQSLVYAEINGTWQLVGG